ncbi:MAG: 2,3-bisphosphoglycerate-independent phosphoglycerate mutase [Paracoccaceae bacterium]|nr:2,3-bisphosphoglycerate-independent phosphoglycerate mutase [Paracoccaceae bacterium]
MKNRSPTILCIMDGWGLSSNKLGNAIDLAETPNYDYLLSNNPSTQLITHGLDVGLPENQMGNSEVGHANIGAGRIVYMDLPKIDEAIENGDYNKNPKLLNLINKLKKSKGSAHLLGLASDGCVHASMNHLIKTTQIISDHNVPVLLHLLTDGRDVAPKSAEKFLKSIIKELPPTAKIATITGRYFAMDRDNNWDRIKKAYDAIVLAKGHSSESSLEAVQDSYVNNRTDEFIYPTVISSYNGAKDGDGFLCLNFRSDRARQIMSAIASPTFKKFDVSKQPNWELVTGMTKYSDEHSAFMSNLFSNKPINNTLGVWTSKHGYTQLRLAESEKYPHVTFFLNGGHESIEAGETRFMPKSPKVVTYDLAPEMSSREVTDKLIEAIKNKIDLIIVNYANPDMVGHTGDLKAAVKACEAIDRALKRILPVLEESNGCMLLTSDHGNCETMINLETKEPHTAHTTNLVPAILIGRNRKLRQTGRLADIAPTLLELMGLPKPTEMTGESLLC